MPWVVPSILAADFANLGRDISAMEEAGARILHLDVMDGHYVPNLTFGLPVIEAIRRHTRLNLDVHLMISNAETTFGSYIGAGARYLSVHYGAVTHLDAVLSGIRQQGALPGVVLNPHTPCHVLEEILPKCHHVLVMSVNPGFGGQEFISNSIQKVRKLKSMIQSCGLDVKIEIDGGIGPDNVEEVVRSGVDMLVAGSAVFLAEDPGETFRTLQAIADQVGVH
ncbi:MAG: ribulose-phosphate 3-epimerase [Acidobacteriota bacterium]